MNPSQVLPVPNLWVCSFPTENINLDFLMISHHKKILTMLISKTVKILKRMKL